MTLAAPGLARLAVPAVIGVLDRRHALGGALVVLAGVGLVLWRHFEQLDVLPRFATTIGGKQGGPAAAKARAAARLLCPDLGKSGPRSLLCQQAGRRQPEAVVAGNESILTSFPDPLILLDGERHIARANPAAEAQIGANLAGRDPVAAPRNPTLLEAVWGRNVYVEIHTVDVHIRCPRRAINSGQENNLIRMVRSAGYVLERPGA